MYFVTKEGTRVGYGQPFTTGDLQYPGNWLRLSTAEEKKLIGLTIVEEEVRARKNFDPRWEMSDGTPIPLEQIKKDMQEAAKQVAGRRLRETDWYVTRAAEGIKPIPEGIQAERQAIRDECDKECARILSATSVDELK